MITETSASLVSLLLPLALAQPLQPPAGSLPQEQAPAVEAGAFEPIRFGDPEGVYDIPLIDDETLDPELPSPGAMLGRPLGSWLASPEEIGAAFRAWGATSPRLIVEEHGRTYEGRVLLHAVVGSERNIARLDELEADLARLSDPRGLSEPDERALLARTPAVAWLGYSIHGDETSGSDAALAVAHWLIASRSEEVTRLLDRVLVVIHPCMNPDGRARFISQLTSGASYAPNLDNGSMHRGRWPYGRTNHYLFDMNRDWMAGITPETRARWSVLRRWRPHLFIDGHEMSGLDTFLFYPQAEPRHPSIAPAVFEWQKRFADDCAHAFDARGWGYYTREWADAWYPAYSDAWGSLNGAIGMLYEQGGVGGQPLQRESGEIVSYKEAVHGQVVASQANLRTLARVQRELMQDYVARRRESVDPARDGALRAYAIEPGRHPEREEGLVATLLAQGVEVWRTQQAVQLAGAISTLGVEHEEHTLPPGTLVVPSLQPQSRLVHAYLELDPRMSEAVVLEERRLLETEGRSRLYDVTAWDLGRSSDLTAWWGTLSASPSEGEAWTLLEDARGTRVGTVDDSLLSSGVEAYAYAVEGRADSAVRFAAQALERGLAVHMSDRSFRAAGAEYGTGSLILRRHENQAPRHASTRSWHERVAAAAAASGARVVALETGRSPDEGPDLGGGHFHLLSRPRVALLSNEPVSATAFGHIWQLLDDGLRIPVSVVDIQRLGDVDLRRFNVFIVPSGSVTGELRAHVEALDTWVRAGGTLVACGSSAAAMTSAVLGLSSVTRLRDAPEEAEDYRRVARRELRGRSVTVDFDALWGLPAGGEQESAGSSDESGGEDDSSGESEATRRDAWQRRFRPAGVFLRAYTNPEHWLTAGCGEQMPVFMSGSSALLARDPVVTPVRLAPLEELRLGGLLWPEAAARLADTAGATTESHGSGQVVRFAAPPAFRGVMRGVNP